MHTFRRSAALAVAALVSIAGCSGKDGANGANGQDAPIAPGAGLKFEIVSATAPASGQPTVRFKVSDAQDNPIDLTAELAAATLGPRWVISQRKTDGTYASLYEATKPGANYVDGSGATATPVLATATQAASPAVTAASYAKVADGEYTVTFATPATATDGTTYAYTAATQTAQVLVGVWGTRTFELKGYPAATTFAFIPAGGTTTVRQVVTDDACNACHKHMAAHDTRRTVTLCLTCHSPQTTDPESGNTVDMPVMIHKLHAGLPGYYIVGYRQSFFDFSKVVFPDLLSGAKNCALCHGATAPTPSIKACKACHTALSDTHGGTTPCAGCHDGSTAPTVAMAHSPLRDADTNLTLVGQKMDITIDSVDANTTAPKVTFTVKLNGAAATLTQDSLCLVPASARPVSCGQLRFTVGGPTSDFGSGVLNGAGSGYGYLTSSNFFSSAANFAKLVATGTAGQYTAPLVEGASLTKFAAPAALGTSIAVGVEAYTFEAVPVAAGDCDIVAPATSPAQSTTCAVREWAQSATAIKFAKIGGGTAAARRIITTNAKCNACHVDLGFHGGEARKTPEYCAFCHHPNNVNDERTTRLEFTESAPGVPTTTPYSSTPNSVSIMNMAHRIHAGSALSSTYVLGADRSLSAAAPIADTVTFAGAFPGDLGDCQTCHAANTYGLPAAANLGTRVLTYTCTERLGDADNFCDTLVLWPDAAPGTGDEYAVTANSVIAPQTAACTSCHDSDAAKGHAELNTTAGGVETCAVCHGKGATYDPLLVHQPAP
jgi:OmcA/MtrC family decaheme c-type cytochrome